MLAKLTYLLHDSIHESGFSLTIKNVHTSSVLNSHIVSLEIMPFVEYLEGEPIA